ncbi:MAG: YbjN domain-containing protein [Rikenellaceae bacterium]
MNTLLTQIAVHLDTLEFKYEVIEKDDVVIFQYSGDNIDTDIVVQVHEEHSVVFMTSFPVKIPETAFADIYQLANEINENFVLSTVSLNTENRRLSSRSVLYVKDRELQIEEFSLFIASTVAIIDLNVEDIVEIAFKKDMSPLDSFIIDSNSGKGVIN